MDLVIPDHSLPLAEGAVKAFGNPDSNRMEFADLMDFCRRQKVPTNIPFEKLKPSKKGPPVITASKGFSAGWNPEATK